MKKVFKKVVGIALAMSMVFSALPELGLSNSAGEVYAEITSSDQLFTESVSNFTVSQWQSSDNSYTGFLWAGSEGTLEEGFSLNNGGSTGTTVYCYQTISKLYPGTYTLTATLSAYGIAGNGSSDSTRTLVYAYENGDYVSSSKVRLGKNSKTFTYEFEISETVSNYTVGYYFSMYESDYFTISNLALAGEYEVDSSSEETSSSTDNIVEADRYFENSQEGNSWTDTSLSDYWGYDYLTPGSSEWWTKNTDSSVTSYVSMNNYEGTDAWTQNVIWRESVNLSAGTYTFSITVSNWDSNTSNVTVTPYIYADDMTGITIPDATEATGYGWGSASAVEMSVVCSQDVSYASVGFTITCPAGCGMEFSDAIIKYESEEGALEVTGSFDGVEWTNSEGTTSYVNGGNFVKGVDISSIISEEAAGTVYKTSSGVNKDVFEVLKSYGVNYVRVRVFNDPYNSSGITYGGGANDAETAVMIAQRAADAGLGVFLSFHMSDFWADPAAQVVPKDWSSLSTSNKATAAATFVSDTISAVQATGAEVGMVTIGNETAKSSKIIAGCTSMSDFVTIVKACSNAVRSLDPDIMVGVHISASSGITYMAGQMKSQDSTFFSKYVDLYAVSVYPYWTSHGTVSNCQSQLESVATTYNVKTMVAEYNWPYAVGSDQDGSAYISSSTSGLSTSAYDVSVSGQSTMITDMFEKFSKCTNMIGMFYWEPAWIAVGNDTSQSWSQSNANKWLQYGCGVATYAGADYLGWSGYSSDSNSGSIAEGSATDEYTLFSANGRPTDALSALNMTSDEMPIDEVLAQVTETPTSTGKFNFRMVGKIAVDDLDAFDSCGFKFEYGNGSAYKALKEIETTYVYDTVSANGEQVSAGDGYKFYTYNLNGIPAKDATYYFKIYSLANGSSTGEKSYQQAAKYYKLTTTSETASLEEINAWEYIGSNSEITHSKMNGTTNGKFVLYPDYIQ